MVLVQPPQTKGGASPTSLLPLRIAPLLAILHLENICISHLLTLPIQIQMGDVCIAMQDAGRRAAWRDS
jgi:hypothetical protein